MPNLKTLTVCLDYLYAPGLVVSACFTDAAGNLESKQDDVLLELINYNTENSPIYLFPVFKDIAKRNGIEFSVKYNKTLSVRRYMYALLIALGMYVAKVRGIEFYKESMKVKYDGF